ncbi:hypothetical protein RBH29_15565 [Herbivorax sp. ANBcel31]|uniref:hypothetical protein n=1 Tax=Herbivorax sp. ANBcel31 TaxID=3069754 RepID=UPI0027B58142|nr:hypothetical protein [Herbivorax sp. ANBcel31]MDQ2087849.1 hypothetical protein [Herbivorax sp. ANBcel31]
MIEEEIDYIKNNSYEYEHYSDEGSNEHYRNVRTDFYQEIININLNYDDAKSKMDNEPEEISRICN